jgi:hypothetical protein
VPTAEVPGLVALLTEALVERAETRRSVAG